MAPNVRSRRVTTPGQREWVKYAVVAVLALTFLFFRHREKAASLFSTRIVGTAADVQSDMGSAAFSEPTTVPVPGDTSGGDTGQDAASAEQSGDQTVGNRDSISDGSRGGNEGDSASRANDEGSNAGDATGGNERGGNSGDAPAGGGEEASGGGPVGEDLLLSDGTTQREERRIVPGNLQPSLQRYLSGPFTDLVNRVMEKQLHKLEMLKEFGEGAGGSGGAGGPGAAPGPVPAPPHNVASRWHSSACQDFYQWSVPRDVSQQPSRKKPREDMSDAAESTAGWRPTGKPMATPQPILRAITWEDHHVQDPNWNPSPLWELPLYLGTLARQVPMYSPQPFVWSSSVRVPFTGPSVRFYPPYPIVNLVEQLGHTLGPSAEFGFRKPARTSFTLKDVEAHKVVAFVQHPLDRFFNAYIGISKLLQSQEFLSPEVRAVLEKSTTFFGIKTEPERFRAFAKDVRAGKWMIGGEDLLTQSYLLSGTDRDGKPLHYDFIGKLEFLEDSWRELEALVGARTPVAISRGQLRLLASSLADKSKHPWFDPATLRIVCQVYAQDFECFDYAVPPVCYSAASQAAA
eukprot:jgi/Mesvir1/23966/Mv25237-RA.1